MIPYVAYFSFLILCGVLFPRFFKKKEKLGLFLETSFAIFAIMFLSVMKSDSVGSDTPAYVLMFSDAKSAPISISSFHNMERGFSVFLILCAKTGMSFKLFQFFVYSLIYGPFGFVIFKKSKYPWLSLLIFSCWSYMVFNFSGIRQGIAMSFDLLAFYFFDKRNVKGYLISFLLALVAFTFHKSSAAFLIFLPIALVKISSFSLLFLLPLSVVLFFVAPALYQFVFYALDKVTYPPVYRSGVGEDYFAYLLIFVLSVLLTKNKKLSDLISSFFDGGTHGVINDSNKKASNFGDEGLEIEDIACKSKDKTSVSQGAHSTTSADSFTLSAMMMFYIGVCFMATSVINYSAPRLGFGFLQLGSLLIPNVIYYQPSKKLRIAGISVVVVVFIAFFYFDSLLPDYLHCNPYTFYF